MYVCNCNGISEQMVQTALDNGASNWAEVHQYFDFSPCCGKCNAEISDTIRLRRQQATPAASSTPAIFEPPLLASDY